MPKDKQYDNLNIEDEFSVPLNGNVGEFTCHKFLEVDLYGQWRKIF